ncbi:hypothetical protein P171DRAFT_478686 [Karstenula rhodostoma CBS 690.94]|uniref:Uncharacterized protein n=1 Tax=Karstenula rhodostoma CBS 690.94 TaxID=1392251 RepID=A0A9P4PYQ3_9PLEO|nr:hypothetical protein P171DRAFT_478686 [Karstenula rhodostoma CBS 690.94]
MDSNIYGAMPSIRRGLDSRSSSNTASPSTVAARRLSDPYQTGAGFINAREQDKENAHGEAIPAFGLTYHHPDLAPSRETSTIAPHAPYTVTPQGSATWAVRFAPTEELPQLTSANAPTAKRPASNTDSNPAKKQKVGTSNAGRKSRMKGKKGEDEGFIPNWDRMNTYSLSTLRNKISNTKIIKYLKEQGVDVAKEFPKMNMVYNGEKTTRGVAMAKKAQELHQAHIDQKIAEGQVSVMASNTSRVSRRNIPRALNNRAMVSTTGSDYPEVESQNEAVHNQHKSVYETDHDEDQDVNLDPGCVRLENARQDNDYDSGLDGVCESDDEDAHIIEKPEPTIVSYIRMALRTIKKTAGSDPLNIVIDGLGDPLISVRAQELIFRLANWEKKNSVFQGEAGDGSPHLRNLLLPKEGLDVYQADRRMLVHELAQVFNQGGGVENVAMAFDMAMKLTDEELHTKT